MRVDIGRAAFWVALVIVFGTAAIPATKIAFGGMICASPHDLESYPRRKPDPSVTAVIR